MHGVMTVKLMEVFKSKKESPPLTSKLSLFFFKYWSSTPKYTVLYLPLELSISPPQLRQLRLCKTLDSHTPSSSSFAPCIASASAAHIVPNSATRPLGLLFCYPQGFISTIYYLKLVLSNLLPRSTTFLLKRLHSLHSSCPASLLILNTPDDLGRSYLCLCSAL